MAFDNHYPGRKDVRRGYRRSDRFDRTCRPGGGCPWCLRNRRHRTAKREPLVETLFCWVCGRQWQAGNTRPAYVTCPRCLARCGEDWYYRFNCEKG